MTGQRKLAAILVADVAGYSRLMGRDEVGTLARLREHRSERFDPIMAAHGGRVVKLTGDGALVEFPSAVNALSAAIGFQQAMADANRDQPGDTAIVFRVGLHLGDLIVEGDDLYGDGVNVAARLEAEAPAGGIVISRNVHEATEGRLKAMFEHLGKLALKNIERPIQAFSVKWDAADWSVNASRIAVAPARTVSQSPTEVALALPDKPSIAVLPFQNMSGNPEQEYFADGMVEEIITALSRFKSLFVIARNSSFSYKGKSPDIRQVGRELGVRYVLEGSVRRAGGRVRITGQLIDAETGTHLWADRFEGDISDVFELQDGVTASIVGMLLPAIGSAETLRSARRPTANLTAYDFHLRGTAALNKFTRESLDEAEGMFARAIALDPGFAAPYAWTTWCHIGRKSRGWAKHDPATVLETERLARTAWALDRDDAISISIAGYALAYVARDLDGGHAFLERATSLNANAALAWSFSGMVNNFLGRFDDAIEHATRAMRLSPRDPAIAMMHIVIAHACFFSGRYAEAISWARAQLRENADNAVALRIGAASLAMSGALAEAGTFRKRLQEIDPARRIGNLELVLGPYRRQEDIEHYREGLRRAGLPEA